MKKQGNVPAGAGRPCLATASSAFACSRPIDLVSYRVARAAQDRAFVICEFSLEGLVHVCFQFRAEMW